MIFFIVSFGLNLPVLNANISPIAGCTASIKNSHIFYYCIIYFCFSLMAKKELPPVQHMNMIALNRCTSLFSLTPEEHIRSHTDGSS